MAKKKAQSKVKVAVKNAIDKSELLKQMGEAAYKLGNIQEELGLLQRKHERAQGNVQRLKVALDKRGKG